ncbi:MAG: phosphonate metabolism protein/1,5-bisphosphokinase (PRPP-forming) PhnN [Burkholderiales bacterium]
MSGRLVYVVGPSGAGKDSVLEYARTHLPLDAGVIFARRFITRPPSAAGEQHIALSAEQFDRIADNRAFALQWEANGLRYGIGGEIRRWMNLGFHVVVNGSRAYLPAAAEKFPDLVVVGITAPLETIRMRLQQRGRENAAEVGQRIERAESLALPSGPDVEIIVNDGSLADAGEQLRDLLCNLDQTAMA